MDSLDALLHELNEMKASLNETVSKDVVIELIESFKFVITGHQLIIDALNKRNDALRRQIDEHETLESRSPTNDQTIVREMEGQL